MSPPINILFLITDQQRYDALGQDLTPNLHQLAEEGVSFSRAYASTPTCTPARAAILTGRSPWRHGMLGYGNIAKEYEQAMPKALASRGYRTVVIGKNHFHYGGTHGYEYLQVYDGLIDVDDYDRWFSEQLPGEDPLKTGDGLMGWNTWRGAAYVFDEYYHPTSWTGRTAVSQINELAGGSQPFFLKVSFHRPHSPYDPPKRLLDLQLTPGKRFAQATDGWDANYRDCDDRYSTDAFCGEVSEADWSMSRRAYLACTTHVDEWIGEVLMALRDNNILENTFILFTSDHGDEQMDHYLWKKGYPYVGSTHVPMIVRWPESMADSVSMARGSSSTAVVELRDIFPTFLDVSGGWNSDAEQQMDGRPLTWLLQGREDVEPWRQWIDLEHTQFYIESWSALTDGEMKYIYLAWGGDEQLFNLTDDPQERRNLASDDAFEHVRQTWRQRLVAQFEKEERGWGWTFNGGLTTRPAIPCIYSPNYPQGDFAKVTCSIQSAITVQAVMSLILLFFLTFCCTCCCCCYRGIRRLRRRTKKVEDVELPVADNKDEEEQEKKQHCEDANEGETTTEIEEKQTENEESEIIADLALVEKSRVSNRSVLSAVSGEAFPQPNPSIPLKMRGTDSDISMRRSV